MIVRQQKYILLIILIAAFSFITRAKEFVVPAQMAIKSYDAHVEMTWFNPNKFTYDIYLSIDQGNSFELCTKTNDHIYLHFLEPLKTKGPLIFRIIPEGLDPLSPEAGKFQLETQAVNFSEDQLLSMIQQYTTRYFDQGAHPYSGMALERSNNSRPDIVTTGGSGFGIMALLAGAERHYLTRERAFLLIDTMVAFLNKAERFHGAWAHWYNGNTGEVFSFSEHDDGGDLVETAFLVQGLLCARSYFLNGSPREQKLSSKITQLWEGVEWDWYTQQSDSLYWHWSKNFDWQMNHRIKGYDETLITYILAASSPTHPIKSSVYHSSYTNSSYFFNGNSYYGIPLSLGMPLGGPLFFTHYSFLALNPHGLNDRYANYFTRNRSHVQIHQAYAIDNPLKHKGYSNVCWGFTSSDDPLLGYASHSPGTSSENGTIAPTAAISSLVYAPELCIPTIKHFYYDLGSQIFGEYGFYDAFNFNLPKGQQVVKSYLAIDQGPIAVMIENYRSQLIWNLFEQNKEIKQGLKKLEFYYETDAL